MIRGVKQKCRPRNFGINTLEQLCGEIRGAVEDTIFLQRVQRYGRKMTLLAPVPIFPSQREPLVLGDDSPCTKG